MQKIPMYFTFDKVWWTNSLSPNHLYDLFSIKQKKTNQSKWQIMCLEWKKTKCMTLCWELEYHNLLIIPRLCKVFKMGFKIKQIQNKESWGLITGCIFWFTGRWIYNWGGGGLISSSLQYLLVYKISSLYPCVMPYYCNFKKWATYPYQFADFNHYSKN